MIAASHCHPRPSPRPVKKPAASPSARATGRAPSPAKAVMCRAPAPQPELAAAYQLELPAVELEGGLGSRVLNTLDRVRALRVDAGAQAIAAPTLAEARGYTHEELYALAEIGYHYLINGSLRIAEVVFEGLASIAPGEVYFNLALGLTYDRLDRLDDAIGAYRRAAALDPKDGRAELNLAELMLARGELARARALLKSARDKSAAKGEQALVNKADALLSRNRG